MAAMDLVAGMVPTADMVAAGGRTIHPKAQKRSSVRRKTTRTRRHPGATRGAINGGPVEIIALQIPAFDDMMGEAEARSAVPHPKENRTDEQGRWAHLRNTIGGLTLSTFAALGVLLLSGCATPAQPKRQTMVHDRGQQVMPFDLKKTQHIFEMTESGGIQRVVARDSNDTEQITLIRQHLHHETMRFMSGDFSDPSSLHGADMPGVRELSENSAHISIGYSDLPNGGQIVFTAKDLRLITAIHRWFGAQLSDHGADATYR